MAYQYEAVRQDWSDFTAGRVFHALPGRPAFPARLGAEIFQRCLALRARAGETGPVALYDPCCGGAYHLAVLGFLFPRQIARIAASDIDPDAAGLAERNLALLSADGLARRAAQLCELLDQHGKPSHAAALESLARLRARLGEIEIPRRVFTADAGDRAAQRQVLEHSRVDLVFSDVPYGRQACWLGERADPLADMLEALRGSLAPNGLVALALDKAQKPAHPAYRRLERFKLGLRQVVILTPAESGQNHAAPHT